MMNNKELKEEAIKAGLCEIGVAIWKDDWTKSDQINALTSLDGGVFLAEKKFPKAGFLLRYAGDEIKEKGLYVKQVLNIELQKDIKFYHFYASKGKVIVPNGYCGSVFVSNKSDVTIECNGSCFILLRVYKTDGSKCKIKKGINSKFNVIEL